MGINCMKAKFQSKGKHHMMDILGVYILAKYVKLACFLIDHQIMETTKEKLLIAFGLSKEDLKLFARWMHPKAVFLTDQQNIQIK